MSFVEANYHWITLGVSLLIAAVATALVFRRRKVSDGESVLGLQHIVTLGSGGWLVLAIVGAVGAVVMIASSAAIGVDYWTSLAINADQLAGKIDAKPANWTGYVTTGVVSFLFLALFFELFSDLGTPLSSGFRQRKNVALARFVMFATVGCIFMSLVTKWGYYDDKAATRKQDAAQTLVQETNWQDRKASAEATIEALKDMPSKAAIDARETAARDNVELMKRQLADAETARNAIPESHSTNRLKAGEVVTAAAASLAAANAEVAAIVDLRDKRARLEKAQSDLAEANTAIEQTAGKTGTTDGHSRERAGDWLVVRLFRVALHQFLCWLFPLVCFESVAAFSDTRKREEANRKRRQTAEDRANTIDVTATPVPPEPKQVTATGYYEGKNKADAEERAELERRKAKRSGTGVSPGYDNGTGDGEETPDSTNGAMNDDDTSRD